MSYCKLKKGGRGFYHGIYQYNKVSVSLPELSSQNVTQYVYISRSQYSKRLACSVATALEARSIPPSFSKTHL